MAELFLYLIFSILIYILEIAAFYVGMRCGMIRKYKENKSVERSYDIEELMKAQRIQKEIRNMLTYDGTPQDSNDD